MSFTDQQVMEEIQYTVIEPPNLGATWPSELWTKAEVVRYSNQNQDRFLKDTHAQVGIANITATQGVDTYALPDDWMATVRMVWLGASGITKELMRGDVWEADHGIPTWGAVQGVPKIYFDATPLTIFIAPIPNEAGTLQIYYIPTSAQLDGTGEIYTVPDECVPSIKYGILADMFGKVARGHDPRELYCRGRYQLGIDVTRMLLKGFR